MGPFPAEDLFGMDIAILALQQSLEKGRYNEQHLKFSIVRKLRSTASNIYYTSI
jgi:hypothetical protein